MSTYDIVGQYNKIGDITFREALALHQTITTDWKNSGIFSYQ